MFTSGRGRSACSGGGGPTVGAWVPVTPPPSSPTRTLSAAWRCSWAAGSSGRSEAAAKKGADPSCVAPRRLCHRCYPSPSLVWPLPSPLPLPPLLRSAAPPLSTRNSDDGGGGRTSCTLPTCLLRPYVHSCRTRRDRRGVLANHRLRQRNVAGGVTSRGSRAGGRKSASGEGFWETCSRPLPPPTLRALRLRSA